METSILLQHIQASQLDGERLQKAMHSEQLRLARATQPSLATQIRQTIGIMLIGLGERLHQAPATRAMNSSRGRTAAPAA